MNNEIEKFIHDTEALKMSESEKTRMKNMVFSYVQDNPVKGARKKTPYFHVYNWYFSGRSLATFSFAFLFIFAGATSTAAENSVPGDVLYPVKVNINESIVKGFSVGSEAKARAYANIAERRLVEIEKIALEEAVPGGRNKEDIIVSLNKEFKENADKMHDLVAKIEESGDLGGAHDVVSTFEKTLDAHIEILKEVDSLVDETDEEETNEKSDTSATPLEIATSTESVEVEDVAIGSSTPQSSDVELKIGGITTTATSTGAQATSTAASTTKQASTTAATTTSDVIIENSGIITNLTALIKDVESQGDKAQVNAEKINGAVASTTNAADLRSIAEQSLEKAADRVKELKDLIDSIDEDSETYKDEIKKAEEAEDVLEKAEERMETPDMQGVITLSKDAKRKAQEVIVLIKTQEELNIKLDKEDKEQED